MADQSGDVIVWVSDEDAHPERMLLQNSNGQVRLLSKISPMSDDYSEIMPDRSLGEMIEMANLVLSGHDLRIPTTLTKTILAASVMKLLMRVHDLEQQINSSQPSKPDFALEAVQ